MKSLTLFISLFICFSIFGQDINDVTLTTNGQGRNQDEATQNALRNAIEQAFGTFISANTEIVNDELIKDEIVSIASGNIKKFEIINQSSIPNGYYTTLLKATVSLNKLSLFAESKGVSSDFKGNLFAANIKMMELYEKNELVAITNMCRILKDVSSKSFKYSLIVGDPILNDGLWELYDHKFNTRTSNKDKWNVPLSINVYANDNFLQFPEIIEKTVKNISMSKSDIENYKKLGKSFYPFTLITEKDKGLYYFRNDKSIEEIKKIIFELTADIANIKIKNEIRESTLSYYAKRVYATRNNTYTNLFEIKDDNFRLFLKKNPGQGCQIFASSLFHSNAETEVRIQDHDFSFSNASLYKKIHIHESIYGLQPKI